MKRVFGWLTVSITGLLLGGCGDAHDHPVADDHHALEEVVPGTRIDPEMARTSGIVTAEAGSGVIDEVITVYGRVVVDPEAMTEVRARFPGTARAVRVSVGDDVRSGAVLAEIESDESLNRYPLTAPMAGVVLDRVVNSGEHTSDRVLFRIVDPTRVWGEFALFPADRAQVSAGQRVDVSAESGEPLGTSLVDWIGLTARSDQSVDMRVVLDNHDRRMVPGQHLTGVIHVATHEVDLVIERSALQTLSGETVVFVQEGDAYIARSVQTGRWDPSRVEVRSGLRAGEIYVSGNSYLIKADIEKHEAVHEH